MKVTVIDKRTSEFHTYVFETHQVDKISDRDGARLDSLLGNPMFEAVFKRGIQRDFEVRVYSSAKECKLAQGRYVDQHVLETAGRNALTDDQVATRAYNLMQGKKAVSLYFDIMTGQWYIC